MEDEPILDTELHAFIDGELDSARAREIAARVAASEELSERAAQYRADKEMIRLAYGPLIDLPIPMRLARPLAAAPAPHAVLRRNAAIAVAAAAVIALVGWGLYPVLSETEPLVTQAFDARHGEILAVDHVDAASIADPAARDRLANDRLALPVKVPDLVKAGYALAAIEIYRGEPGKQAMQLRYRGAQGQDFTLFLRRSSGPDRFDLKHKGATQICIWQNDDLSVVMLGEMSAKDMLKLATLTYADLNF